MTRNMTLRLNKVILRNIINVTEITIGLNCGLYKFQVNKIC